MRKSLITVGIVAASLLMGCKGFGGSDTEITPGEVKVNQSHEMENPGTVTDRTIEIKINPKSEPVQAKPLSKFVVNEGLSEPIFDTALMSEPLPAVEGDDSTKIKLPGDKEMSIPKGESVTINIKENIKESSKKVSDKSSAESKGSGIKTNGDVKNFDSSAPNAELKGVGNGDGGNSGFKGFQEAVKSGSSLLIWLGAALIVAGVVVGWGLKEIRIGIALALGGGVLIGTSVLIDQFPWVFLAIPVAVLGIGAYLFIYMQQHGLTLKTIVTGIEDTDPEAAAKVKASISEAAGANYDKVKSVVSKTKKKLGL